MRKTWLVLGVLVLICAVVAVRILRDDEPVVRYAIAVNSESETDRPSLPATAGWPYTQRLPYDWNFDEDFGFRYELVPRVTGKGTLAALVDGNADIAFMAAPPLVRAVAAGEPILVLAQTERSDHQLRIVAAKAHRNDWLDGRVGMISGTVFETALYAMAERDGRRPQDVHVMSGGDPTSLTNSLVAGIIDSTIALQPTAALLTMGSDGRFVDVTPPEAYLFTSYVVTTRDRWEANREGILRAMEATAESRRVIANDPETWLRRIHEYESGDTPLRERTTGFWDVDEIVFDTDRDTILDTLSSESALMVSANMIPAGPNFSEALSVVDVVADRT